MPLAVRREQIAVPEKWLWIAGGVAALIVLGPTMLPSLFRTTARAAGEIIVKSAEGVVIGIGEAVGIPPTDAALCEQAVAAGEWLNASLYCPAGTFLKEAGGAIIDLFSGDVIGYTEDNPGEAEIIAIEPVGGNIADYPAA